MMGDEHNCANCRFANCWGKPEQKTYEEALVGPFWNRRLERRLVHIIYADTGVQCLRYPVIQNVWAGHWCGEWSAAPPERLPPLEE